MRVYRLNFHHFSLLRSVNFGNVRAIFPLGFEVVKETKQQQIERIRLAWAPWKAKLEEEAHQRSRRQKIFKAIHSQPKTGKHGIAPSKEEIKRILEEFWAAWPEIENNELKIAALNIIANRFGHLVGKKRLRKVRKIFDRDKWYLLNIPDEQCATCERKARVRHHIIPLGRGGTNSPLNLILICDHCHVLIHPWMVGK
jgi:hypothetical protein